MMNLKVIKLSALLMALAMCLCAVGAMAEGAEWPQKLGNIGTGQPTTSAAASLTAGLTQAEVGDEAPQAAKSWTFMVYICGSNLEDPSSMCCASKDILEMSKSGFDADRINVVVYTGGTPKWGITFIPSDKNAMWDVGEGTLSEAGMFEPSSMGDAQTLQEFLSTSVERYPAEKYALILWNHGGGPIFGVCFDDLHENDGMTLPELTQALANSPFSGQKLAMIGFDACLMGSLEVAGAVSDYADYMVASEEAEPGLGWNYEFLGKIGSDTTAQDVGKSIIDSYFDALAAYNLNGNNTMSCLDLNCMGEMVGACDTFFAEAAEKLSGDTYLAFAKAREKSVPFGHQEKGSDSVDFDLMDLSCFLSNLDLGDMPAQQALLETVNRMVVAYRADNESVAGMALYHPYYSGSYYPYYETMYRQISPSKAYCDYVGRFAVYLNGGYQANYSGLSTLGNLADQVHRDINTTFGLLLTPEQIDYLAEAQLQVLEGDEENGYALVSIVPDVEVGEDNRLTATYVHRALFAVDEANNVQSAALPFRYLGNHIYSVDATLVGHDAAGQETRQAVRLRFELLDKEGELELKEILLQESLGEGQTTYTARNNINLGDYDALEIVRETRRPVADADGALLGYDAWEPVGSQTYVVPLNTGWSLRMLHEYLEKDNLYVSFAIRDYYNRRYASDLIPLVGAISEPDIKVVYDDDLINLKVPYPTLQTEGSRQGVSLSIRVTNCSDVEDAIVQVANVRLNGQPCDLSLEIYGNGANEGLTVGEEEMAKLLIPTDLLQGVDALTEIDFDIVLLDAANGDAEAAVVPVHVDLNLDVSELA